jgi:hypothetical protein
VRRDRGLHSISARFTHDGGHFSHRYLIAELAQAFDPAFAAAHLDAAWVNRLVTINSFDSALVASLVTEHVK